LCGEQDTRRARADDQNVDLIRKVAWTVDSDACRWKDPRVAGHIAVVVELHCSLFLILSCRSPFHFERIVSIIETTILL
jgi:hypothetical protein